MQSKLGESKNIRLLDRVIFTWGVIMLTVTQAVLSYKASFFWIWYTITYPTLYGIRYVLYKREGWSYFLLDFCYWTGFGLLALIHIVPHNHTVFKVLFFAANGPVISAIITWRNSLVFHSLDKLTSLVIHMFPPLLTFCWRWYPAKFGPQFDCEVEPQSCDISITENMAYCMGNYLLWQVSDEFQIFKESSTNWVTVHTIPLPI